MSASIGKTLCPKLILQREGAILAVLNDLDRGALDGDDFDAVVCITDAESFAVDNHGGILQAIED